MKLGIVISTNATSFSAVSHGADLGETARKCAELGYDGIELAVRDPKLVDCGRLKKIIRSAGLDVPAIGTGQAFLDEGLSFIDRRKGIRAKAVARIKAHVCFAVEFNAAVIIGLIRGRGHGNDAEERKRFEESLDVCAEFAAKKGVALFLEPLNRYETRLINSVDEGIDLVRKLKHDNLKLLIDTFHMNIEEPSIYGSMVKAKPWIGHVHFADSNRRPPGCGHLGFLDVLEVLKGIGYNKYVSMEMMPWPDPDRAARMSIEYVKGMTA